MFSPSSFHSAGNSMHHRNYGIESENAGSLLKVAEPRSIRERIGVALDKSETVAPEFAPEVVERVGRGVFYNTSAWGRSVANSATKKPVHGERLDTAGDVVEGRPTSGLLPPKIDYISANFLEFLKMLNETKGFADGAVIAYIHVLLQLVSRYLGISTLPDPQAMPGEAGSLEIAWDIEEHQFDIEVFRSGRIDWFWRNSETGEFTGEDNAPLLPLPQELLDRLQTAFQDFQR
jgi:hypothetical protein